VTKGFLLDVPQKESAHDAHLLTRLNTSTAAAVKYLKDMHERQQVVGCVSGMVKNSIMTSSPFFLFFLLASKTDPTPGKAIVYHLPQSTTDLPSPETLTTMSNELTALRSSTTTLALEAKALKAQLAALGATVSISELRDNVARLEKAKQALTERVEGLRVTAKEQIVAEGGIAPGGDEDKKKVEEDINLFTTALGRRKKIAVELWDVVRQMMPPKVKNEEEWKVSDWRLQLKVSMRKR